MGRDYFRFRQFEIRQEHCAMKVSSLACILGAWARHPAPRRVLDIGTGTGLLALMLAQRYEAPIDAVEIEAGACHQAGQNFARSPWPGRLRALRYDIRHFEPEDHGRYDFIVSNPPFFNRQQKSGVMRNDLARHDIGLNLSELVAAVLRLLTSDGLFAVLLPPEQSRRLTAILAGHGLALSESLLIRHRKGAAVKAVAGLYGRTVANTPPQDLSIYAGDETYSPEYRILTGKYYLFE
jgi:tRNA1Val (adenine37-N6)-methyltransferase